MKRVFLFLITNILVVISLNIVYAVLAGAGLVPTGYAGSLIFFSLLIGMGGSFISLLISKWAAKKMMGVQIVDTRGAYAPLVNRVHTLARQAGLSKMPEVGIYDSQEVNAFATGPSKSNSLVAVSSGLLQRMDDNEVHGVLAHEVAHIANGDMVTMTLVQGIVNSFAYMVSFLITNAIASATRGDSNRGIGDNWFVRHLIFNFVYGMVSFAAYPIVAGFSRFREFKADAGGARLAGAPVMIAALQGLQNNTGRIEASEQSFQSMKISNKQSFARFFSTHPPLEDRIKALQSQR